MGTLVSCKFSHSTAQALQEWCSEQGIPNPTLPERLHATVIWSVEDLESKHHVNLNSDDLHTWRFKVVDKRVFDHRSLRYGMVKKCLVLVLSAHRLKHLYLELVRHVPHTHPDYTPHVTVSYDVPDDLDLDAIQLPTFELVPTCIYTEIFK